MAEGLVADAVGQTQPTSSSCADDSPGAPASGVGGSQSSNEDMSEKSESAPHCGCERLGFSSVAVGAEAALPGGNRRGAHGRA